VEILRVAVWGIGNHAINRIVPAIKSIDKLSLVGICSRNESNVKKYSISWNCIGWIDPIEMLKDEQVDVVFIATPIAIHYLQALQVLNAGKHVWCEKPLTCSHKDTQHLVKLARNKNLMLTESFMYLYHSQFKTIQNFIRNSDYGQLHSMSCKFGIPNLDKPGFRNDVSLCGGAFWDIASYPISAALSLLPCEDVEVLFSELIYGNNDLKLDTEGRALLRFSNGTRVNLEWGSGLAYKNEIALWFDNASFFTEKIFSKPKNYIPVFRISDKNGNESLSYGEPVEQFVEMFNHFLNTINVKKQYDENYNNILNRSKMMNEIINFSKSDKTK
jgi:dTDP-3,4-didehydro-2,6-dideoxy-alpha-D-glucose 3-reductase